MGKITELSWLGSGQQQQQQQHELNMAHHQEQL